MLLPGLGYASPCSGLEKTYIQIVQLNQKPKMSDSTPEQNPRLLHSTVCPKRDPLFHNLITLITLEDLGSGEYVNIKQSEVSSESESSSIQIHPDQWPSIRKSVDQMVREIHIAKTEIYQNK